MNSRRILAWLLRLMGSVEILAFFAVFMPRSWMEVSHTWLGMGQMVSGPLIMFMIRQASFTYGMHGVTLWVLASDVARFRTLVILNAVGDVATIASGRADQNTGAGTVAAGSMMQTAAIAGETRRLSLAHQQAIWSNEALRHNTLFPGSGTGGRVYVPIDLDAGVVWLHVRTGGRVFSFPFQQTVTQVAEPRTRNLERGGGF